MQLVTLAAPGGTFGGALRLQFNFADDCGPNDLWKIPAQRLVFTKGTGDGVSFTFDLGIMGGSPGSLYVSGGALHSFPDLGVPYSLPFSGGGGGGNFRHGTASTGRSGGSAKGTHSILVGLSPRPLNVTYDFGFDLPMHWDGSRGDCVGTWWANWTVTVP
jgi:hypothetical protein